MITGSHARVRIRPWMSFEEERDIAVQLLKQRGGDHKKIIEGVMKMRTPLKDG